MARAKNTPNDPQRRERILTATMRILQEEGISAVRARTVAAWAEVPLSSVSYHFPSVRELLLEASRRVAALRTESLEAWSAQVTRGVIQRRLAEQIHEQITTGRELTVIAYELYLLGLRDEDFRSISHSVAESLREALAAHLPAADAARLAATADGLQLSSLLASVPPSVEELEDALRTEGAQGAGLTPSAARRPAGR